MLLVYWIWPKSQSLIAPSLFRELRKSDLLWMRGAVHPVHHRSPPQSPNFLYTLFDMIGLAGSLWSMASPQSQANPCKPCTHCSTVELHAAPWKGRVGLVRPIGGRHSAAATSHWVEDCSAADHHHRHHHHHHHHPHHHHHQGSVLLQLSLLPHWLIWLTTITRNRKATRELNSFFSEVVHSRDLGKLHNDPFILFASKQLLCWESHKKRLILSGRQCGGCYIQFAVKAPATWSWLQLRAFWKYFFISISGLSFNSSIKAGSIARETDKCCFHAAMHIFPWRKKSMKRQISFLCSN